MLLKTNRLVVFFLYARYVYSNQPMYEHYLFSFLSTT